MGAAAVPLSLAATGLSAGSSIMSGITGAQNAQAAGQSQFLSAMYAAERAKTASMVGELKATQTDTYMRQKLGDALANIDAVLAGTGAADSSPTSWAVKNRVEQQGTEARVGRVTNIRMQAQQDANDSLLYMMSGINAQNAARGAGDAAMFNGFSGAAGAMMRGLSGIRFG